MIGRTALRLLYVLLLLIGLGGGLAAPGLAAIAAAAETASPAAQAQRVLYTAEIDGAITPITAQYLSRAISLAERDQAAGLLIRLDTPGGLESAMRDMAQSLLGAQVPTIVYVAPAGARAASAGLFVTLAAHVAAMAPGTNIGAAHPVALGQDGQAAESTPMTKATEDAAALVRSLATTYGRNATWAEQAVRESVAITAAEALDRTVIDFVATDITDLLQQLEGQTVSVAGQPITLQLAGMTTQTIAMTWLEQLLAVLANPNVALILMSLGTLGLFAELQHPGTVLPGVLGAGALILGLVALGNLPFNWAGLALLALAAVLLIAEVFIAGFGAFGVGSIIAFVLGAILLFFPLTPAVANPNHGVGPSRRDRQHDGHVRRLCLHCCARRLGYPQRADRDGQGTADRCNGNGADAAPCRRHRAGARGKRHLERATRTALSRVVRRGRGGDRSRGGPRGDAARAPQPRRRAAARSARTTGRAGAAAGVDRLTRDGEPVVH